MPFCTILVLHQDLSFKSIYVNFPFLLLQKALSLQQDTNLTGLDDVTICFI